ncbi:MAG: hypothetical protein WC693_00550 [Patescibacteria group bacterium]|jgi:hypothetical protein
MHRKKITIDTNVLPLSEIDEKLLNQYFEVAYTSVTEREVNGTSFEKEIIKLKKIFESGIWGESTWGNAVFAGEENKLNDIIQIISSSSFPIERENLTAIQKKQLRDAMILEAHFREKRNIFVTNDNKAFINYEKREKLEKLLHTKIMTKREFINLLNKLNE